MPDAAVSVSRKSLQKFNQFHWLILLLFAPAFLFMRPETSWLLLIFPLLWGLRFLAKEKPFLLTPVNGLILLLAIQMLVSTYATYDIAVSLPKISGLLYALALFFAFSDLGKKTRGIVIGAGIVLAAGLGMTGLGLLGTNWATTKITILNPVYALFPRLQEMLPGLIDGFHPNEVAGAIIWVLPVWIALFGWFAVRARKIMRVIKPVFVVGMLIISLIAIGMMSVVLVFTQSRSAYLGFALGLVLMSFLLIPGKFRWLFAVMVLLAVAGLLFFVLNGQFSLLVNELFPGSGLTTTAFSINTLSGRVEIWARAIYAMQDFAFTGMGMNTFRHIVHVLYPLYTVSADVPVKDIGHAHNEFLQSGLDLGIPGMIAFIGINIVIFWMLFFVIRRVRQRSHRPVGIHEVLTREFFYVTCLGLIGGLFAHFLFGITDAISLGAKPGVVYWLMIALTSAIFIKTQKRDLD